MSPQCDGNIPFVKIKDTEAQLYRSSLVHHMDDFRMRTILASSPQAPVDLTLWKGDACRMILALRVVPTPMHSAAWARECCRNRSVRHIARDASAT